MSEGDTPVRTVAGAGSDVRAGARAVMASPRARVVAARRGPAGGKGHAEVLSAEGGRGARGHAEVLSAEVHRLGGDAGGAASERRGQ